MTKLSPEAFSRKTEEYVRQFDFITDELAAKALEFLEFGETPEALEALRAVGGKRKKLHQEYFEFIQEQFNHV